LNFMAQDGADVFLVFLIMSDERDVGLHLKSLAHIARLVNTTDIVEQAKNADNAEEILRIFRENETKI